MTNSFFDEVQKARGAQTKTGAQAIGGCLGLLVGIFVLVPLFILLAWNVGIAAVASVPLINFGQAIGLSAAYWILRGLIGATRA